MKVFLLGSTDLTQAIGNKVLSLGIEIVGCSFVQETFKISYSTSPVANLRHTDMGHWCKTHSIPATPFVDNASLVPLIKKSGATFILAVGWYHMVPPSVRSLATKGCAGIHASYLPDLRGGAPLNWAILSGRKKTGVSLFLLDSGIDDGDLLGQLKIPIADQETIASLIAKAEEASLQLIETCLPGVAKGELVPFSQKGTPTYCQQRVPADGKIDWRDPLAYIDRLIRAVGRPYGGAFSYFDQEKITIWRAALCKKIEILGAPGQIATIPNSPFPFICTPEGPLEILEATDDQGNDFIHTLKKKNHQRFCGL